MPKLTRIYYRCLGVTPSYAQVADFGGDGGHRRLTKYQNNVESSFTHIIVSFYESFRWVEGAKPPNNPSLFVPM